MRKMKCGRYVKPEVAEMATRFIEKKRARDRKYREVEKDKEAKLIAVTESY